MATTRKPTEQKRRPLGLLRAFQATPQQLQKLEMIEQLDLSREKAAMLAEKGCEPVHIELAERELKRFLALSLLFKSPEYPFAPSRPVDALWHQFILNTRKYRNFCDMVYGHYLDHKPESSRAKCQALYAGEVFEGTRTCLRQAFGYLPEMMWADEVVCNSCQSGGDGPFGGYYS